MYKIIKFLPFRIKLTLYYHVFMYYKGRNQNKNKNNHKLKLINRKLKQCRKIYKKLSYKRSIYVNSFQKNVNNYQKNINIVILNSFLKNKIKMNS
jgi:hypothetical protein